MDIAQRRRALERRLHPWEPITLDRQLALRAHEHLAAGAASR